MAQGVVAVFAVVILCVLAGAQEAGPKQPPELRFDSPSALTGSALTCSSPEMVRVPALVVERAKVKARLINLLRESLFDDAKGIVNIGREKEIRKLVSKLKSSE